MTTVFDKVQAVRSDMNRNLLEREEVIDHALLALLTRQHHLQVGGPGCAKSLLVDALRVRITGVNRFKVECNPGTTDAHILGPQDLLALADHGQHKRIHARSAVEGHICFFEEIGRANQLAYDVCKQILGEEREIDELGMDDVLQLPLITAFAASNTHLVGDQKLEALNNRFLLRDEVTRVRERANKKRLATHPPKPKTDIQATMTLAELVQAQEEAQRVTASEEVLEAALDLDEALAREGILITDRLWTWSFPLLKAQAWLNGASETSLEDLGVLAAVWWQDPKEKVAVQRAIYAVSNPLDLKALEIEDDAMDLLGTVPHEDAPDFVKVSEGVLVQMKDMLETLLREIKASRARKANKVKAIGCLNRINTAQKQLAAQYARRTDLGHIDISDALVSA